MKIYMYEKNSLIKHSTYAESINDLNERIGILYPLLNDIEYVACEYDVTYPILENGIVREKTREERILLDNETDLLLEGEKTYYNKVVVVPIPTDTIKPKWVCPNWIEDATLEQAQEFKRIEFKSQRDVEILSDYLYTNGHIYDADLNSRNRLFQAQQLGVGTSSTIEWITADNKISTVSNEDLNNIVNGIAFREQQAFSKFSEKYQEVLNCSTVESVKNINW